MEAIQKILIDRKKILGALRKIPLKAILVMHTLLLQFRRGLKKALNTAPKNMSKSEAAIQLKTKALEEFFEDCPL